MSIIRLTEVLLSTPILDTITPFSSELSAHVDSGHPIGMGWNTALMIALLCIGLLFHVRKKYTLAQFFSITGISLPAIGLTGFIYGIEQFHGQMSVSTICIGMPAGLSILLLSANKGPLRVILNPWISGKLARIQLFFVTTIPLALGFFIVKLHGQFTVDFFGIYVVSSSASVAMLIGYTSIIHESFDSRRRHLEQKLAHESLEDALTSLPNRRYLITFGSKLLTSHSRRNGQISLLMLDIDHFKHINDTFGHLVGDKVLKQFAELVQNAIRQQDMFTRYGGEEFVLLLPDTALEGAMKIAEKIRATIESSAFKHVKSITISIGCTQYTNGQTLDEVISKADQALYIAKSSGRNQVASVKT